MYLALKGELKEPVAPLASRILSPDPASNVEEDDQGSRSTGYKKMAEEKLQHKIKILPYTCALIRWQEYWQPGYIVEQDGNGNCVVFLPDIPETNKGRILLAKQDQVRMMSSVTANQLDASLKKTGKGLLSEYGIRAA